MPGTISAGGNILYSWAIAPTLAPTSVTTATTSEQAFTVQGLQVQDVVEVNYYGPNSSTPGAQTTGIGIVNARVSAANTLQIGFMNTTAGTLSPATGTYTVIISRCEAPISLLPTTAA